MPSVKFTSNLKRFYPDLKETELSVSTINDLVSELDSFYPGISDYIIDESGALRKHVNIFIGNDFIKDRLSLSDEISDSDTVYIMQALSGG